MQNLLESSFLPSSVEHFSLHADVRLLLNFHLRQSGKHNELTLANSTDLHTRTCKGHPLTHKQDRRGKHRNTRRQARIARTWRVSTRGGNSSGKFTAAALQASIIEGMVVGGRATLAGHGGRSGQALAGKRAAAQTIAGCIQILEQTVKLANRVAIPAHGARDGARPARIGSARVVGVIAGKVFVHVHVRTCLLTAGWVGERGTATSCDHQLVVIVVVVVCITLLIAGRGAASVHSCIIVRLL